MSLEHYDDGFDEGIWDTGSGEPYDFEDDPRNDPGYDLFDRPDAEEEHLLELDDEYDGDDPEEHKLSTRKSRRERNHSDT